MNVLGFESSCDETAVAIVGENNQLLSNCIASQISDHRPHGGVVPELASRQHILNILPVYQRALADAKLTISDIDGVAVSFGPGLVGALLVGLQFAKGLAMARGIPFVGVNHLEGHIFSPLLSGQYPEEKHLALLVSGGHTQLIYVEAFGDYKLLGTTRDDAAGEAFDKVAKMLGLGYPGGPEIERRAKAGDPMRFQFPRALNQRSEFDFSFSGLKTAVAQQLRLLLSDSTQSSQSQLTRQGHDAGFGRSIASLDASCLAKRDIDDVCASFQAAISETLCRKTRFSCKLNGVKHVVAGGGVMANAFIRHNLSLDLAKHGISLVVPPLEFCTDNGAMIALAGRKRLLQGERSDFSLNAKSRLPLNVEP